MLDPNRRALYTAALKPPPGYELEYGIATTFSLDLVALLSVPLQLALLSDELAAEALRDPVATLEAVHRVADRLTVYCQRGQILVPRVAQILFSMLEPLAIEVKAPRGGVFHPKLWVLSFRDRTGSEPDQLRLLVLSRNLTFDRSWDLSLALDGEVGTREIKRNAPLVQLITVLPSMAVRAPNEKAKQRTERAAAAIACASWQIPEDFDDLAFHVLGLSDSRWTPPRSDRLAVLSPFCDLKTLDHVSRKTTSAEALITRADTLNALGAPSESYAFKKTFIVTESAESEDGEDTDQDDILHGLHAKAYIWEKGETTTLVVGSANATSAALLAAHNVEVLAELWGPKRRVGTIETLLGENGLGEILELAAPDEAMEDDKDQRAAEEALENARKLIAAAGLAVACEPSGENWRLVVRASNPISLAGIASARAWPITLREVDSVDASSLANRTELVLASCALVSVTGLTAFELTASAKDIRLRFVLNLPLLNEPDGRFAAVTRSIVSNRQAFIRYLLLLLAELGDDRLARLLGGSGTFPWSTRHGDDSDSIALLEPIVRSLIHDRAPLASIARLLADLRASGKCDEIIPEEFLRLWQAVEPLLDGEPR